MYGRKRKSDLLMAYFGCKERHHHTISGTGRGWVGGDCRGTYECESRALPDPHSWVLSLPEVVARWNFKSKKLLGPGDSCPLLSTTLLTARGNGLNCVPTKRYLGTNNVTYVGIGVLFLLLRFGVNYVYASLCAHKPAGACRIEKRMLGFLELELQAAISHLTDRLTDMVTETQTQVLCKSYVCSCRLSQFPSP